MPKLFACIAGMVALAAGIFGNVESTLCMQRAAVAFVIGAVIGAFWQSVTSVPVAIAPQTSSHPQDQKRESALDEAA
jgi:hypothetical protein